MAELTHSRFKSRLNGVLRHMNFPFPTRMGSLFIVLSFILYVASMQSGFGLILIILGLICACYVINIIEAYRSCKLIEISAPEAINCSEGETVQGTWEIRNPSKHFIGHASVESAFGTLFKVGALDPESSMHLTPELKLPKRGVFPFRSLQIVCTFPFGFMQCRRLLWIAGEIVVYPRVYECEAPVAAGYEPMVGGRFKGANKSASGDSFHGVRPLQPSDPVKLIHWASSSKGLGVMVKEFEEELSGRVGIIMDGADVRLGRESMLDWGCRLSGSLMLAALDEGHQVEFLTLGKNKCMSVPPFADGSIVLNSLARLKASGMKDLQAALTGSLGILPSKASLCYVLTDLDDERIAYFNEQLASARRKICVYVPEHCKQAEKLHVPFRYYSGEGLL